MFRVHGYAQYVAVNRSGLVTTDCVNELSMEMS